MNEMIQFAVLFVNNFNSPLIIFFTINFASFFEMSAIFFGSLFNVNLCSIVSGYNNKKLISPLFLYDNCDVLSRVFK